MNPPTAPSHVLPGLNTGVIFVLPNSLPVKYAPVSFDSALMQGVPAPGLVKFEELVSERQAQLDALRERTRTLLEFWESEIATIENQRANFDARISVQDEIVASTADALAAARQLSERGLQTASNLSAAEQREADEDDAKYN